MHFRLLDLFLKAFIFVWKSCVTLGSEVIQRAGWGASCSSGSEWWGRSISAKRCLVPFQHVANASAPVIRYQKDMDWCRKLREAWGFINKQEILSFAVFWAMVDDWLFSLAPCTTKITISNEWLFGWFGLVFKDRLGDWSSGFAPWLGALATFPEDSGSIPRTYIAAQNSL